MFECETTSPAHLRLLVKIRVLSDLHLESGELPLERVACDVVVLAGDIDPVVRGMTPKWARTTFGDVPVIWIMGNHEYYDWSEAGGMRSCLDHARHLAREFDVTVLENDAVTIDGIRFLGSTLWTDFRLLTTPAASMTHASLAMSDFRGRIFTDFPDGELRYLRPEDVQGVHRESVRWLRGELTRETEGASVVVTHHGPHALCVHPGDTGNPLSPAFCSNLASLIEEHEPRLWISGHTHASHDVQVGKTRLVSNQRGYDRVRPRHADAIFRADFVVEI